jgi:nicotinamidase-related amidase
MERTNGSLASGIHTPHTLLTPDNCVLALVDYQPQMFFASSSSDRQSILNNAVGLAKAARAFDVPVVLGSIERASFSGNTSPILLAALGNPKPIERSTMNAWDVLDFVAAIERTGRKKIVLGGLWTEACVTFPTLSAIQAGYEVYIPSDICGALSPVSQEMTLLRCIQAGAVPMTWLQVVLEWQLDWARTGTYNAVMEILKEHAGAYGMGVEYAFTMVHGAPATQYPAYVPARAGQH